MKMVSTLVVILSSLLARHVTATQVNGAGASFPSDVYSAWMPAFKAYRSRFTSVYMTYDSIGSGGGKSRIKGNTEPAVEYAGSDSLLSEEDYARYPDLQMFPSMAGPIVIAFNLPGIKTLNLKMEHLVSIYSGKIRWWNDSQIVDINPSVNLPYEEIRTVARREKSGTTEIFTGALASINPEWADTYGIFSKGLDSNDHPYNWNASVVTLFGQTNRGVSGLILSIKYSLGYLVLSDAKNAKVSYAKLQNSAGNMIEATAKSVQNAMQDFAGEFNERMTLSLANPKGLMSYPISGYTYIIVRKTTMTNCQSAIELLRYIEWFYTNQIPRQECENLYMVPLSKEVYTLVLNNIVRKMTCKGQNIYQLVLDQIAEEQLSLQTWRVPVYVGGPVLGIVFILLFLYVIKNQIVIHRELLREEWLIPKNDIKLGLSQKSMSVADWSRSKNKVHPSSGTVNSSESIDKMTGANFKVGTWRGRNLHITTWSFLTRKNKLSLKTRRTILWMRNSIRHNNVTLFYGITDFDEGFFSSVSEYCTKGSVYDLVRNVKLNMNNAMKYTLSSDVSKGMLYLFNHGITHGCLTSKCCYLDASYIVKIGDWQKFKIASYVNENVVHNDAFTSNNWEMEEFWTAPELLRMGVSPSERSDVYSFSILMQEIFSRDSPYVEHMDSQEPNDILQAVISTSLRPVFTPDTPVAAREIMERSWEMDPFGRPSFSNIYSMLKSCCSRNVHLMDCMMETLEDYTRELEDRLEEFKLYDTSEKMTNRVVKSQALPPEMALDFNMDIIPVPEKFDSASVMVSVLHGFADIVASSSPSDISTFLNDWYTCLDNSLSETKAHKFDALADTYLVVSGLPTRRNDHATMISKIALNFLLLAKSFTMKHSPTTLLQMRIGIGSGPGMAGVLQPKFLVKYSVFGKTMDTARRLADTTPPMTIHLSEATASYLNNSKEFSIIPAQTVHEEPGMKRSYWLIGSRSMTATFPPPPSLSS